MYSFPFVLPFLKGSRMITVSRLLLLMGLISYEVMSSRGDSVYCFLSFSAGSCLLMGMEKVASVLVFDTTVPDGEGI